MNRTLLRSLVAAAGFAATVAGIHRWFDRGPWSFRAEYRRLAAQQLAGVPERVDLVAESDLTGLPDVVARFLRATGAVGSPRISNVVASVHGRIRSGDDQPWMSFAGEQTNHYGGVPTRLFRITASMRGMPTEVFHSFIGAEATMRARAVSIVPVVDASGPEMNRSETVTIFNDMCVLAPAALVDADVTWEPIDERSVRGSFTRLDETVTATMQYDDHDRLVDFVSDDRYRSSPNGSEFAPQRWSTPLDGYRPVDGRIVCTGGEGRWHPDPDGVGFAYVEFVVDRIEYNVGANVDPDA